jgi:hypothetical protein
VRGDLVLVFKQQVFDPLLVDLDFDLVFLFQVLQFAFFVAELCFLIFQVLLFYDPKVIEFFLLLLLLSYLLLCLDVFTMSR